MDTFDTTSIPYVDINNASGASCPLFARNILTKTPIFEK